MTSFLLGLVIGLVTGFIGGLFYYAKRVHKHITTEELTRETINSIIMGDGPKGDFISVNPVTEYIRNHEGQEIKLGDVIEE